MHLALQSLSVETESKSGIVSIILGMSKVLKRRGFSRAFSIYNTVVLFVSVIIIIKIFVFEIIVLEFLILI